MLNRIIRIAATTLGALLLLAGCARTSFDPAPGGEISFSAGSALLRDDATKSGTPKDSFDQTSDAVGAASADKFFVWGAKTISASKYTVFDGDAVTLKNLGSDTSVGNPYDDVWTYSPARFWDSNASQYDFMAISGPASASAVTCSPDEPGRMEALVTYSPIDPSGQTDILAAFYQRSPVTPAAVHFNFTHILSAVSVVIVNDSPTLPITLNSYRFKFIATTGTGRVRQNGASLATMNTDNWISLGGYSSDLILGSEPATPAILVKPSDADYEDPADPANPKYNFYPTSTVTDLMIPQDLHPENPPFPQLVISYSYNDGEDRNVVTSIPLHEIKVRGSEDDYITEWKPGRKYNYEIHIRIGGGIYITVTTTDWEVVNAETPGLAIYDE